MDQQAPQNRSRRGLLKGLTLAAWAALVGAAGLALASVLRMISADSGPPAPASLDLGPAADLKPGQVKEERGVALVRDPAGIYALSLVCPHLGCRPGWNEQQRRFLCPCHGSIFAPDGSRLAGPADRGLDHLYLEKDSSGHIVVHPARKAPLTARLV